MLVLAVLEKYNVVPNTIHPKFIPRADRSYIRQNIVIPSRLKQMTKRIRTGIAYRKVSVESANLWKKAEWVCGIAKSQSSYSVRCDYRVVSLNMQGNILKVVESLSVCVCVCVCLFRSSPTPGEQNRRVYMVNTNKIHQHHFSFRWLAVMSSTSKACFICRVSGNKGFSKYGKQTLDSVQNLSLLVESISCLATESSSHCQIHAHMLCLCMNVADLNSYPGDIH